MTPMNPTYKEHYMKKTITAVLLFAGTAIGGGAAVSANPPSTCYVYSTGEHLPEGTFELYTPAEGFKSYGSESVGGTPCRPVSSDLEGEPYITGPIPGSDGLCSYNGTVLAPGEYELYSPAPGEPIVGTSQVGFMPCRPISAPTSVEVPVVEEVEEVEVDQSAPAPAPIQVIVAPAVVDETPDNDSAPKIVRIARSVRSALNPKPV